MWWLSLGGPFWGTDTGPSDELRGGKSTTNATTNFVSNNRGDGGAHTGKAAGLHWRFSGTLGDARLTRSELRELLVLSPGCLCTPVPAAQSLLAARFLTPLPWSASPRCGGCKVRHCIACTGTPHWGRGFAGWFIKLYSHCALRMQSRGRVSQFDGQLLP